MRFLAFGRWFLGSHVPRDYELIRKGGEVWLPRTVFISSVQTEFVSERAALRDFIRSDPLLSRHFEAFLFEDQPAQTRNPKGIYLDEVDKCAVYVGIIGDRYGSEDADGVSPTEREFDRAVQKRKQRLVFIRAQERERDPKVVTFLAKIDAQLTRRTFVGVQDLTAKLYHALIAVLESDKVLTARPFDAATAQLAFSFIDGSRVDDFIAVAKVKRGLQIRHASNTRQKLVQLDMFDDKQPSNAAFLLFSNSAQKVAPGAEVACVHYGGIEPLRPSLSHKVFKGTLFEQTELAVGFVMDRLASAVGVRTESISAPTAEEIPRAAINEAVVNAIAHRDYTSNEAVQITVYADRVEVANPGELPYGLTPAQLLEIHPSIPRNPLIASAFFLSGLMDKYGSGTLDMVRWCRDAGLPDPLFRQRGSQWTVTFWRDWLNEAFLVATELNQRQIAALAEVRLTRRMDNARYMQLTGAATRTAARDLQDLMERGILIRLGGETGRGVSYQRAPHKPSADQIAKRTGPKPAKATPKAKKKTGLKPAKRAKTAKKPK